MCSTPHIWWSALLGRRAISLQGTVAAADIWPLPSPTPTPADDGPELMKRKPKHITGQICIKHTRRSSIIYFPLLIDFSVTVTENVHQTTEEKPQQICLRVCLCSTFSLEWKFYFCSTFNNIDKERWKCMFLRVLHFQATYRQYVVSISPQIVFSTWLRYVWLMAWKIRLPVVCDVRAPYSGGFNFSEIFLCIVTWPSGNSPTKNHEDHPRGSPQRGR